MRKTVLAIAILYVVGCLVIDFLPSYGTPHFRYTGSDPQISVWNLGWPLAEFIYDSRSGLHWAPTAGPLLAAQIAVLIIGIAAWYAWASWRSMRGRCVADSSETVSC